MPMRTPTMTIANSAVLVALNAVASEVGAIVAAAEPEADADAEVPT